MPHSAIASVVSNSDATPITKVLPVLKGGQSRSTYGNLTIVATTAAQTNCFVRVPVRARIKSVKMTNLTGMGNGSLKLGVFRPNDGIAISDAVISAAVNLGTARTAPTEVLDAPSAANRAKTIADWLSTEIGTAGATNDVEVDIVASVVTVSTGTAVAVGLEVEYVVND